jgi:hypothetical protein
VGRPRAKRTQPEWFDLRRYEAAAQLDAAGWYLNLRLRIELAQAEPGAEWARLFHRYLRNARPVLTWPKRWDRNVVFDVMDWAQFGGELDTPDSLGRLLRGRPLPSSVEPLSTAALYHFERLLPEEVRAAGRRGSIPSEMGIKTPHGSTAGSLDEMFEPQFLGRFVRVDLSAPNDVLIEDFRHWIDSQRRRLAALPGPKPFQAALEAVGERYAPKPRRLQKFAERAVLPLIDLRQWQTETGEKLPGDFVAELLGIKHDSLRDSQRDADLVSDPFALTGWLAPRVRAAGTK